MRRLAALGLVAFVACAAGEIHVDRNNKVVSTPAYMLAGRIGEVADGVEKLVKAVLEMAK